MSFSSKTINPAEQSTSRVQPLAFVGGFHLITLILTAIYIYVRTLPPTPIPIPTPQHAESAWWGFWPITYIPTWAFAAGLTLFLAVLIWLWVLEISGPPAMQWSTAQSATAPHARAAGRASILGTSTTWMIILSALLLAAFYLFPIVHTRWGDAYILSRAISWPDPTLRLTHTWQAPLDVALHSWVWHWLHEPLGWGDDAIPVYYLLSPIAGFFYLVAAIGLAREARFAPAWLTFGLLVTLGIIQQFFGYIENYSFIQASILAYLWLAVGALRGDRPLWQPALILALSHALHPSTIILAPSLLFCGWLIVRRTHPHARFPKDFFRRTVFWPIAWSIVWPIVWPMLLVFSLTILMMEVGNHGIIALFTHDRPGGSDGNWFVPLFETQTRWQHYTMFSWLHLRDFLNQQVLVSPVVLWSLLWIGAARLIGLLPPILPPAHHPAQPTGDKAHTPYRGERAVLHFLMACAALYLLFVWVWNPDYGGQRDWDLFGPVAIPTTVLLIYVLPRVLRLPWRLIMAAIPMILLQALHTAAWIYQNTLPWDWP